MTTAEIKSTGTACLRGKREDLDNRTTSVLLLINLTNLRKVCLLVVSLLSYNNNFCANNTKLFLSILLGCRLVDGPAGSAGISPNVRV
jgi:hypothetical protein